ncbi:MAG: hypothetical protein JO023_20720 [Chloroflexi bacterium]|nr:hypothetical protein [Chloroflexota bacterium]
MRKLLKGIRWRLVGWTMLVLVVILGLIGSLVYVAVERILLNQTDLSLIVSGDQAVATAAGLAAGAQPQPGGPQGYRGGIFFVIVNATGQVETNPQQVNISQLPEPLDPSSAPRPPDVERGGPPPGGPARLVLPLAPPGPGSRFQTTTLNGVPTRILMRPLPDGSTLYVGESLAPEENALNALLFVLVASGVVGLALSLVGAWFLAGRALIPIEQAFRRQQEFVADASHELRTPLTVLNSATELLDRHRDEPLSAHGALFDDIRAEIERMERLATDLLTLARSDQGEVELMVAPIDLAPLAGDVVRHVQPLAAEHHIQLTLDADSAAATVEADPDRLQQVLLILIDNAIKHTPTDGTVTVRVRRLPNVGQIEVSDTGTGIAPEDLPRIFDRFYRADNARGRAYGGTGLGLAIARMLVDAHRGSLSVTSTVGAGTSVWLRLPLVDHPARLGDRIGELAAHFSHAAARD